jgi:outer membrane protein OmpA-like peptidoglycan-associated protein
VKPVAGLTMTAVKHSEVGDAEVHYSLDDVTPGNYVLVVSGDIPNPADPSNPGHASIRRTIRIADDSLAHRLNFAFASADPPIFPGSTFFPSKAILSELKSTGHSSIIVGDGPPGAEASFFGTREYYRGDLTRVGGTTVSVIVNGAPTPLPAIEARGHLSTGSDGDDLDIVVFDNPDYPLWLKWNSQGRSLQITEIEWPESAAHGSTSGHIGPVSIDLGKTCRAEVHGIYFAFGSAKLVGESDLALSQVSKVLADNPTWVVTVEGHTDSIGTRAANLDLSKRRAAAVRDALVTRFGVASARLSAAGYGDTRPVAPNATIEGRARNRRVELARKC